MEYFTQALESSHSTILFGSFGRYPSLIQFYLNAIPDLEAVSDEELLFWYVSPHSKKRRLVQIIMEPSFGTYLVGNASALVFTSHLHLKWNSLHYKVMDCHFPSEKTKCFPEMVYSPVNNETFIPPINHAYPPLHFITKSVNLDLSLCQTDHEAFLRLCTFLDVMASSSQWYVFIPHALRKKLISSLSLLRGSPYASYLLRVMA